MKLVQLIEVIFSPNIYLNHQFLFQVIVVPKAAGGNGKDKVERFGFSISNLEEGSFQCLKSTCQG